MRRTPSWLGLLATLALLVATCGGEDALTDRAYFEALEEVALAAQAQDEALDAAFPFDDPPDAETIAAFLEAFQATFIDARAAAAVLAAPSDLAAAHDASVAAQDAVIDAFETARADVETFADLRTFFDEAGAAFDEFGRACVGLEQLAADRGISVELFCPEE